MQYVPYIQAHYKISKEKVMRCLEQTSTPTISIEEVADTVYNSEVRLALLIPLISKINTMRTDVMMLFKKHKEKKYRFSSDFDELYERIDKVLEEIRSIPWYPKIYTTWSSDNTIQLNRLASMDGDFTIVLGATQSEDHIKAFKHSSNHLITIDEQCINDPKCINMNLNNIRDWNQLSPLFGRVSLIIFDYSVIKFIQWNEEIVDIIYNLLGSGGKFIMDNSRMQGRYPIYMSQNYSFVDHDPKLLDVLTEESLNEMNVTRIDTGVPGMYYYKSLDGDYVASGDNYISRSKLHNVNPDTIKKYMRDIVSSVQFNVNRQILLNAGFSKVVYTRDDYPIRHEHRPDYDKFFLVATK